MSAIDTVYNYYLTTYGKTNASSRYESHKKSELRDVYNKIVKENKEEPLYKINMTDDVEKFIIDLKESARQTKNVTSFLSGDGEGIEGVFNQKVATSSDEDSVAVTYIGNGENVDASETFKLGVKQLATPQIVMGRFLDNAKRDFEEGNFSFDLDTPSNSYEFQFDIDGSENNLSIQQKIARLVNRSDIGISAEVVDNGDGASALRLVSRQTGLSEGEEYLFKIQSGSSWNEIHTMGLDQITANAGNAVFTLNGNEHSALANTFTINNEFEINLKDVTDGDATIGFKANVDSIGDSVEILIGSYNHLLDLGDEYGNANGYNRLSNEVTGIWHTLAEGLTGVGIVEGEDGKLAVDREILAEAVTSDRAEETFGILDGFKNAMSRESDKISMNPVKYIDKRVVEYKNPGKNFSAPYASSTYAGLMINEGL
jgi:flagellar hook-associated protein 2